MLRNTHTDHLIIGDYRKEVKQLNTRLKDCEWSLSFLRNCILDEKHSQYKYENGADRVLKTLQALQLYLAKIGN